LTTQTTLPALLPLISNWLSAVDCTEFFLTDHALPGSMLSRRAGNGAKLIAPWRSDEGGVRQPFVVTRMYLSLQEESLAKRRDRVRGVACINQVHMLSLLSKEPLETPSKSKKHFAGTTNGDLLGPLQMPEYDASWVLNSAAPVLGTTL